MRTVTSKGVLLVALLILCGIGLRAQNLTIVSVTGHDQERDLPSLTIVFSQGLCTDAQHRAEMEKRGNLEKGNDNDDQRGVLSLPSATVLDLLPETLDTNAKPINVLPGFGGKRIEVKLEPLGPTTRNESRISVNFGILYACAQQDHPVKLQNVSFTTGAWESPSAFVQRTKNGLDDAIHQAKTTSEKDIFGGFSAAKGEGQSTEGNADINFNRTLYQVGLQKATFFDAASIAFHLKKSSAMAADPKEFGLGLKLRRTLLHLRGDQLRTAFKAFTMPGTPEGQEGEAILKKHEKDWWRAFLLDENLKVEGEAFNFNVTNFVSDTQAEVVFPVLGRSGVSHASFRLVPAGLEAGRNMHAMNGKVNQEAVIRGKFGATFSAFYKPTDPTHAPVKRLEVELGAVGRYLFENETLFDAKMAEMNIGEGPRRWYQADVKAFFAETDKSRIGFRLSFSRGSLPPAFAFTSSLQYGIVMESTDDTASNK